MPRSLKVSNYGDDTCLKCNKDVENAVAIVFDANTADDKSESVVLVFCEDCLTEAIGDASQEDETTEMLPRG